jgi:dynein heavy chain
MNDSHFLGRLSGYDKDNIPQDRIDKIRAEFIPLENFNPETVKKSSAAAEGMCTWVCAMDVYERVEKEVKPKKASLAKATVELAEVEEQLAVKVAELKTVEDKIQALNDQ